MNKKVVVDQEKCIACGACVAIAGSNFSFDENGLSKVVNSEVNDDVMSAVDACPVDAITIIEDGDNQENDKCHCEDKCNCGDDCNCDDNCHCSDECDCGDDCDCDENHKCNDNCHCHHNEEN